LSNEQFEPPATAGQVERLLRQLKDSFLSLVDNFMEPDHIRESASIDFRFESRDLMDKYPCHFNQSGSSISDNCIGGSID